MDNNDWLRSYGERHPVALEWARGTTRVHHSLETQGRVFRLAEQLRVVRDWSTIDRLFSLLQTLDDVVDSEIARNARPAPESAVAAGLVGYQALFGKLPAELGHDWPEGFERADACEAELATIGLRAHGFDPIVIDGLDPAAYLWALFERHERLVACIEVIRLHQHPVQQPSCLAIIPDGPSTDRPQRLPAQPYRKFAGAASS
jgi:hypothetical protein